MKRISTRRLVVLLALGAASIVGAFSFEDAEAAPSPPDPGTADTYTNERKLQSYNSAIRATGSRMVLRAVPSDATFKLSLSRLTDGNARLGDVGPGLFKAAGANSYFRLLPSVNASGVGIPSRVSMYFPNESGKLYVLDCRVQSGNEQDETPSVAVSFKIGQGAQMNTQQINSDVGHALVSFIGGPGAQTQVEMSTVSEAVWFFGCELTKVN